MSWYFLKTYGHPNADKSRGWLAFNIGVTVLIAMIIVFAFYVLLGAK